MTEEENSVPYEPESQEASHEIRELARQLTQASLASFRSHKSSIKDDGYNPFTNHDDPSLDPDSPDFDSVKWRKYIFGLKDKESDRYPILTAGLSFKHLGAYGYGSAVDFQKTAINVWEIFAEKFHLSKQKKIQILKDFSGLINKGETCVVLGRPGSGCSTFLRAIGCDSRGFKLDEESLMNYQGIPREEFQKFFRGEVLYMAETDVHFPELTVGQTLLFAALARTPHNRLFGVSRAEYAQHIRDVTMATFGLSHTIDTKVGNEYIRGVSGGERKRVSISEAYLRDAVVQCWDNSTRGLDAATALEFCKSLKVCADTAGTTILVSLYQASQDAYDSFNKVTVLYKGRQIYFGKTGDAKQFFIDMGFECPERQTTGDFLTSLTSPSERRARSGFEDKVPRTPDEFAERWKSSNEYAQLLKEIDEFNEKYPIGSSLQEFHHKRKAAQASHMSWKSPYTISFLMQIRLNMTRSYERLIGNPSMTFVTVFGNTALGFIGSSIFYNMSQTTDSFYHRGATLFFATLLNAFMSALEILMLFKQRPIVEKQQKYAFCHPSTESLASLIVDLPSKFVTSIGFNFPLYFIANLRREAGAFFTYWLFSFITFLTMTMIFRTIASSFKSYEKAMVPASLILIALVIYSGFVIPVSYMHGWARWINYIDPVAYAFESMMVNEFRNRVFSCLPNMVPRGGPYSEVRNYSPYLSTCGVLGAEFGTDYVQGSRYIADSFKFYTAHLWRNLGIMFGFLIFFLCTHLLFAEYLSMEHSKGEVLVFKKGHIPKELGLYSDAKDVESGDVNLSSDDLFNEKDQDHNVKIQEQTGLFQWKDVCYDVRLKNGDMRRLLDHVDGYVKPKTLTALMGASGAGKTTLLDVLADRKDVGVVSGDMLVNGSQRDASFQRKTGYVQQLDLHLASSTVRESLRFSAVLRQPAHISLKEKYEYVEEIIELLEMGPYSEAVVGVEGVGLNVEQRKRLTIGVELSAKPELLLFLDEPTSGLDSQTAWAICKLMRKLANSGQAILCTIHQPSALLFQQFDRLLFLQRGGQTVYYGDIGPQSRTLIDYFVKNGAPECPTEANPAEWMLSVIGAAPGSHTNIDWFKVWTESPEREEARKEIDRLTQDATQKVNEKSSQPAVDTSKHKGPHDQSLKSSYAASITTQLRYVTIRSWLQVWRNPNYVWSKIIMSTVSPLFIGFSFFKASNDQQGLQNQMYAFFMLLTMFIHIVQQVMPTFVVQRDLYEVRERPSKTYSWVAFITSNMLVDIPWQILCCTIAYFCFYYPVGLWRNAEYTDSVHERGALFFMILLAFHLFTSSFSFMIISGVELPETGANIAILLFTLTLLMCGVLASPDAMPGFWIFLYRLSPFTYIVGGLLIAAVSSTPVSCKPEQIVPIGAPPNMTCGEYLDPFISVAGGAVYNPSQQGGGLTEATLCQYCQLSESNFYLDSVQVHHSDGWRNFGLLVVYCAFNWSMAYVIYWIFRLPHKSGIFLWLNPARWAKAFGRGKPQKS